VVSIGVTPVGSPVVVGPGLGGPFGQAGGNPSTTVDVDRSARQGSAFAH
jgi:hypothetical protein